MTAPAGSEDAGLVLSAEERKFVHALHATPINPTADGCPLCVVEVRVLTRIIAAHVEAARAEGRDRMRRWLDDHAEELVLEAAIRIAEGSQEARNGPVGDGDAGDGRGHGRRTRERLVARRDEVQAEIKAGRGKWSRRKYAGGLTEAIRILDEEADQ